MLDDAPGGTELTPVPRQESAGPASRREAGLTVEHVESFPKPSLVKPQRFVVPRRLLAYGTFWLSTLQVAALCGAMLSVLALHGFPFQRAFHGQRFDNWGKQVFMCKGPDGPPDPSAFVNVDGERFQPPTNRTDGLDTTWKDAFRDGSCLAVVPLRRAAPRDPRSPRHPLPGYVFWSPSTSVTGDASAVGDCTFPAKNYRGERDKMTGGCSKGAAACPQAHRTPRAPLPVARCPRGWSAQTSSTHASRKPTPSTRPSRPSPPGRRTWR